MSQNLDFFLILLFNDEMKRQILSIFLSIFLDEIYKNSQNAK